MFMRKVGRRYLLLHSVREGATVAQRRLYTFPSLAALRAGLEIGAWEALRVELTARCPELRIDWERLREKAKGFAQDEPVRERCKSSAEKLLSHCRALANLVEQEVDPQLLAQVSEQLDQIRARIRGGGVSPGLQMVEARELVAGGELRRASRRLARGKAAARAGLPARRQRVDSSEAGPRPYLEMLDLEAEIHRQRDDLEARARVLAERVRLCPTPTARAQYGAALQLQGEHELARDQYRRLPARSATRYLNEASLHWKEGRTGEALAALLLALAREPGVVRRRNAYWSSFGELWDIPAIEFFGRVASEPFVRRRVREARGRQVRRLMTTLQQDHLLARLFAPAPHQNRWRANPSLVHATRSENGETARTAS